MVGYSRYMETDEEGTLASLKSFRETLLDPAIIANNGRIVKLVGDGTLAEFASVVDAVSCAVSVQGSFTPFESPIPIVLRIGINLGDVIIDGEDVYGNGVNVASRLEALAPPGGICVSSTVYETVSGRIGITFSDAGMATVKNISRPIRIWKWHPNASVAAAGRAARPSELPSKRISIAVLPFTNMSADPEQDCFSDGISEDIIIDLSKLSELLVISRNSSFTYKGRSVDVRTVGRDLGVQFVLEGSVRRADNRVRITAQLTDATTGGHLWAERFDRQMSDLFAVQDDVTGRIIQALRIKLTPTEKERLTQGGTTNIEAYEYFLRARQLLIGQAPNRTTSEQAKAFLKLAIEFDPNYSRAFAGLGFAHMYDYQNRWSAQSEQALDLAKEYASLAVQKDPNEPFARLIVSFTATFEKDFGEAIRQAEAALALNPNMPEAYAHLANIKTFLGEPREAIPLLELATRLDPAYSQQYLHLLGVAHLLIGNFETAAAVLRQRIVLVPETDFSRAMLASALGHLGDVDEARRVWQELKTINPKYSFRDHLSRQPFASAADVERIADGLRKAEIRVEV